MSNSKTDVTIFFILLLRVDTTNAVPLSTWNINFGWIAYQLRHKLVLEVKEDLCLNESNCAYMIQLFTKWYEARSIESLLIYLDFYQFNINGLGIISPS